MHCTVKSAGTNDSRLLLDLMQRFPAESGFALDRESTGAALCALLANPAWGGCWLALCGAAPIGFATFAVRFAMEHEGLVGCIDDLYVEPAFRRHGVAHRLLAAVIDAAALRGCKAMLVEAGASNAAALDLVRLTRPARADRQPHRRRRTAAEPACAFALIVVHW